MIFLILFFLNLLFNCCHDLTTLRLKVSDSAIITIEGADYRFIIHGISKSEAIHFLENSVHEDFRYM